MNTRYLAIVGGTFAGVLALCFLVPQLLPRLDRTALIVGDIVMALLTLFAFFMVSKSVSERPQAFVRGVYSATLLKLMVCMVGIVAYAVINKATLYKPTIFALFGIYIIYTIVETAVLSRSARR